MITDKATTTFPQKHSQPSRQRLLWMDIVRGAAILAVITFHSVTFLERYHFEAATLWRRLNETLTLFRMPILVFLSGMLLPRSLAKPGPEYLSGKVRAILWPFLLWSTIYALVTAVDFTNLHALRNLYTGGSHLWFLAFIFVYYLVAKPLSPVDPLAVAAFAFVLSVLSPEGEKYSERIFYLMSLFFLGSAVSRHAERIDKALRSPWIWLLAPIVVAAAMMTVRYNLNYGPYWVFISFTGIILFSALAQRAETMAISRPLIWIGQRSIVFYVSHAVFIIIVAKLAGRMGVTDYPSAALASIIVSLVGGWVLAAGMKAWPPVKWLFTLPAPNPRRRLPVSRTGQSKGL